MLYRPSRARLRNVTTPRGGGSQSRPRPDRTDPERAAGAPPAAPIIVAPFGACLSHRPAGGAAAGGFVSGRADPGVPFRRHGGRRAALGRGGGGRRARSRTGDCRGPVYYCLSAVWRGFMAEPAAAPGRPAQRGRRRRPLGTDSERGRVTQVTTTDDRRGCEEAPTAWWDQNELYM